jgi:hypothetical protein
VNIDKRSSYGLFMESTGVNRLGVTGNSALGSIDIDPVCENGKVTAAAIQ